MHTKQLVNLLNIKMAFGEQSVLDFEKFTLYQGERIGLVGANGSGKSTLLKIIAGELTPNKGVVDIQCDIFYFKQFSEGIDPFSLKGKEIKELKVKDKVWQENRSGGEETRVRLAQMLSHDKPVALLDEPTSNLDVDSLKILKKKLAEIETFILVSHDRSLLNLLCTKIVEVEYGNLHLYEGNYDTYVKLKEAEVERQWKEYETYTAEKKRLQQVYNEKKQQAKSIEKRPKNMSAKEAKLTNFLAHRPYDLKAKRVEKTAANVLKRIENMEVKEKPKEDASIKMDFELTEPPRNAILMRGEDICFSYDSETVIFENASFEIENKRKIAIVGKNGAGKTTLLRLIKEAIVTEKDVFSEEKLAYEGIIRIAPKASIGIFEQDLTTIQYDKTVLENVLDVSIQKQELARIILARLLLSARDMKKMPSDLSGGERVKLAFAMLFVSKVNVLILDEPTNYLDLPSIEALERMLSEYEGTVIFFTHDEEFIKNIATDILMIEDKKIIKYQKNIEDYFKRD